MTQVMRVVVTGAAGQIGYSLLPMIAKGEALGPKQPIQLVLFDLPKMENVMKGIALELQDLSSPLLKEVLLEFSPETAFKDADLVICLAGLMALGTDTPRAKLMSVNEAIYKSHGEGINKYAKKTCKVLVVANPDNTLALALMRAAPDIPKQNITSMNRLDQNRAQSLIAQELGIPSSDVRGVIIWGNHANTMVPDYTHCIAKVGESYQKVTDLIKKEGFWDSFVATIRSRAYKIVELRGNTSALSSATAAVNHIRDWFLGTPEGHYSSMGVYSTTSAYGAPSDVFFSMPCICQDGTYKIVEGIEINDEIKDLIKITGDDLVQEKQMLASK